MSTSPFLRTTAHLRTTAVSAAVSRSNALFRAGADIAHKRSRVSLIAASAATVGVLGTAGVVAGTAPWAQAVGNVATTAQGGVTSAPGQPGASLFQAVTGAKPPLAGGQLDATRSAAAAHAPKQAAKQPAKPAAKKPAKPAAKPKAAKAAVKHQAAKPKAHAAPPRPYFIYDSVKPETIPSGKAAAVYANGAYAAFPRQMSGHNSVLWIDTNGSDPGANVLDVEPGDATPHGAAQWVKQRLSSQPHSVAIVYTMRSEWQQVKDNVGALPGWMQSKVRYWIADPTGVPHVVAGSSATQWYWGNSYDVTTANPDFVR
jgi:hypothetical protein